ncbi:uncharacterized protein LOC114517020 [Dendronephthya gigantea]|uniref:uncharacterized protein LOC114517020 n=1 Tax=Dendronephthya gigantea TaxID=151771 RepID=UPI00106C5D5C|nr:uncharacterized protein LOC114517020 [Dendronephthya gigantea]
MMDSFNPVLALENARSAENEVKILEKWCRFLSPNNEQVVNSDDGDADADSDWLRNSNDGDVINPFPDKTPQDVLKEQECLNKFTFYLFERRYGWSEHLIHLDSAIAKEGSGHSCSGRSSSLGIESKSKGRINELLDDLLKWYICQKGLSVNLLKSLTHTLSKASNFPVVRNQTLIHILDWLKVAAKEGFEPTTFSLVKDLIVTGLTDVWSAIRNACAARLSRIIDSFTIPQLEHLFLELEQICKCKTSSWQAKEGAVMGMTTIIRSFHASNLPATKSDSSSSPKFQMTVKFGKEHLMKLPEFITDSLYTVVFSLLAHPQVSIREHASKAFTSILSRSESQYIEKSFRQVIIHLCKGTGIDISSQKYEKLPHHAVLREDFTFLDAYEAQGLLEVSIFLIKRIPVNLLMDRWPLYFSTYNLYLMHPASTVRQASSVVFKYLVTKDYSSPKILKLVLQCLCDHWKVSTASDQVAGINKSARCKQKMPAHGGSSCCDCQEYCSETCQATWKCKRPSIKTINKIIRGLDEESLESSLSSTWEWREGRLFAYELILKYLITNHIHYVFPSYAFSYSPRNASCSVDEALLKRNRCLYSQHSVPTYTGRDSTCSLPASMEVPEEGSNIPGRCSAPGTRKEEVETLTSNNLDLDKPRKRTSSFSKPEISPPRLVRQTTVAVLPPRPIHTPSYRKQNDLYFADSMINKAKLSDQTETKRTKKKSLASTHEKSKTEKDGKRISCKRFDSFYNILTQILFQTIECLEDSRWELRRMSQQILPLITETLRWFDISILEDFWSKYLSRDNALLCYSACIALQYSISHAGKLRQFIDQPPATWKDIESCCSSAMSVFCSVNNGLQAWLPKVTSLLQDVSTYDRITVSAMEVVLTRQAFLPLDSHSKEKNFTDSTVCDVITSLFLKAHPDSPCAPSMKNSLSLQSKWDRKLHFPADEFSCLSSKGLSLPEQARQTERFLFLELHSLFGQFLGSCRLDVQVVMLPILVHSVHSFCDDTAISHSLVLSITKVTDSLRDKPSAKHNKHTNTNNLLLFLDLAIWEFSFLITQRSIDLAVLRQLQELFLTVFEHIDQPSHLKDLFHAVSTRLNYEPDMVRLMNSDEDEDDDVPWSELQLLSNDIPTSPVTESPLLQNDSDDDDLQDESVDRVIQESVALNRSNDSLVNGGTDGYGREESGAESDEAFSDWDSCEELILDNAREAIGDFINHLWMVFKKKEYGTAYFMQELKKCGEAVEMVIRSILDPDSLKNVGC